MILVVAGIQTREDSHKEALALCLEHVKRSRAEPGCIDHRVHTDEEDPHRLVFVEHWDSREALAVHFQVPACRDFAAALSALAAEPPKIKIYETRQLDMNALVD